MKKIFVLFSASLFLSSCLSMKQGKIITYYKGLNKINLFEDHTYLFDHTKTGGGEIRGTWSMINDTLILNSEYDPEFIKVVDIEYSESDTSKYSVIDVIFLDTNSRAYFMGAFIKNSDNESPKDTIIHFFIPTYPHKLNKKNNYNLCTIEDCHKGHIGKTDELIIELKDTIKIIIDYPTDYRYHFSKGEKFIINKREKTLTPIM